MKKTLTIILTLALFSIVCSAQIKYKMFVGGGNTGQYKLSIIPLAFDSSITDDKILHCVDTLPAGLMNVRMYHLLYKSDSTKLAVQINEGTYLFHTRFTITEYYKNGNTKRITYYSKNLNKYWEFNYYADAGPQSTGNYSGSKKQGTWSYYNTQGLLIKQEKYNSDGTVKSTEEYNPPKSTFATSSNPKHPKGQPYVIQ